MEVQRTVGNRRRGEGVGVDDVLGSFRNQRGWALGGDLKQVVRGRTRVLVD